MTNVFPFLLPATLALSLATAAEPSAPPASGDAPVTLESASLRLEIRSAPFPALSRLIHRASGRVLVAGVASVPLFTASFTRPDGKTETIDGKGAGESGVQLTQDGAASRAIFRFGKFAAAPALRAEATADCRPGDAAILWSLRLVYPPDWRLGAVRFPQMVAVPVIGDASEDDFLVLPALAGTLIGNPAKNWQSGQSVTLSYPGNLSAQFLAYQDRTAGLCLAGRDAVGHPMSLVAMKQGDGMRFWHDFSPVADEPGAKPGAWESPYAVALQATQGTWCHTADLYKGWALQQPWCARKLVDRSDIPAWWKDGPDVHVCEVRTYDGRRTCTGSYYPELLDHLRAYRSRIDGPVVPMLAGWENHRRWTAGDYFPVFDAAQAGPVLRQLREQGFRPFFYLSGLYSTFRNEGRDGGEIPAAQQHLDSCVLGPNAKPREYLLNESNPAGDWKRHSYQFCAGAPGTKPFFRSVVDQALELGVEVLQMDQTVNGAGDACHAPGHGHAAGPGLYQSQAFWDLLDDLRQHGKKRSADFVLFHEEAHEQLIPHLDGFHVREYYEKRWYRGFPGAVGIPLFSYLYHEFALGYGGDSASLSKESNRWNVRCHAVNLITGRTPGGSVWSSHANAREAHPDQVAVLREHSRLLRTPAKDFLLLGTMLHPLELDVPRLPLSLPVQRGGRWVREEVPTPAILTSSWQAPDGRAGHLFLNLAETPQALTASLDTRNLPAWPACSARIYHSSRGGAFAPLWEGSKSLPQPFSATLQPLEVVFVELSGPK